MFGHTIPNGLQIPSHSAIVSRRVCIRAVVNNGVLVRVVVSIRGWMEE